MFQSDKRLRELGIGVHSPAISGILDPASLNEDYAQVETAIIKQRKAIAGKKLKAMTLINATNNDLRKANGHDYQLDKIKPPSHSWTSTVPAGGIGRSGPMHLSLATSLPPTSLQVPGASPV